MLSSFENFKLTNHGRKRGTAGDGGTAAVDVCGTAGDGGTAAVDVGGTANLSHSARR